MFASRWVIKTNNLISSKRFGKPSITKSVSHWGPLDISKTSQVFNESKLFLFACHSKGSELIRKVDSWRANEKGSTPGICTSSTEMAAGVALYHQWWIFASHLGVLMDLFLLWFWREYGGSYLLLSYMLGLCQPIVGLWTELANFRCTKCTIF